MSQVWLKIWTWRSRKVDSRIAKGGSLCRMQVSKSHCPVQPFKSPWSISHAEGLLNSCKTNSDKNRDLERSWRLQDDYGSHLCRLCHLSGLWTEVFKDHRPAGQRHQTAGCPLQTAGPGESGSSSQLGKYSQNGNGGWGKDRLFTDNCGGLSIAFCSPPEGKENKGRPIVIELEHMESKSGD